MFKEKKKKRENTAFKVTGDMPPLHGDRQVTHPTASSQQQPLCLKKLYQ